MQIIDELVNESDPTHFIALFLNADGTIEQTSVAPISEFPSAVNLVVDVLKMQCIAVFKVKPHIPVEDIVYRLSNYKLLLNSE